MKFSPSAERAHPGRWAGPPNVGFIGPDTLNATSETNAVTAPHGDGRYYSVENLTGF